MNSEQSSYDWRMAGISVSILLLLMLLMYHETVMYLIGLWNDLENGAYGHGYLILAISGYLILINRKTLASLIPCPSYLALLAVLAVSLVWTLVVLVDVLMLQTVILLLFILSIVWAMLGNQVTGKLLFPILFIGFALPVWDTLIPVLQDLSTDVVFRVTRMLGIPALQQGYVIVLPAGSLSITEGCSGLRYFIPGMALGALYGYLNYATFRARFIVFLISSGAAVLANILRIFIVVYAGYVTDMQHPLIKDHLVLGWYLFGGLVVILLVVDALFHRYYQPPEPDKEESCINSLKIIVCGKGKLQYMSILVASAVLLSAGPAAAYWINHQSSSKNTQAELELPLGTGGWSGPVDSDNDWMPEYRGAIAEKQAYQKDGKLIDLYIGYYPTQKQGKELIFFLNQIGNKDIWHSRNLKGNLRLTNDRRVIEQLLEKGSGEQRLVWYWYNVAGWNTVNPYQAKALQVLGLVTGMPDAYIMAVAVNSNGDITDARKVLDEFVSIMETSLAKFTEKH